MANVEGGNRLGRSLPRRRSRIVIPISRMVEGFVSSHSMSTAMKTLEREEHNASAMANWAICSRYLALGLGVLVTMLIVGDGRKGGGWDNAPEAVTLICMGPGCTLP
jgi:hypothetical protein